MSDSVVNSNPEGQGVMGDVNPSEAASSEYPLVDNGNSYKPLESEGLAKGEGNQAASDMENKELPVQDQHPLEEGQGVVMDEDNYEETTADDKSKSASMTPADIHDMVNDALDFKLENFQSQLHQMMTVIQNVSQHAGLGQSKPGMASGKNGQEGEAERENNEEMVSETLQEDDSGKAIKEDNTKERKDRASRVTWENDEEKIKWEEYLGKVSSILDMAETDEKSVLDGTVQGSKEKSVSYLPAEGIVKNSWQKVKDKGLVSVASVSKKHFRRYYWSLDDIKAYGWNPKVNPEIVTHITKSQGTQGKRRNILPENLSRLNHDIVSTDDLFHYQLRIMSYASYFLAGLSKVVKGEKEVEEETVFELLNNLGQCLIDICDTAVKGSVFAIRSRRRVHLDAMKIVNNKARSEVVNQPLSFKLFSADCKSILEKHKVQLLDANSVVNRSGAGGSGAGGNDAGGSGAGGGGRGSGRGGGRGGGTGGRRNSGGGKNDSWDGTQVGNKMSPASRGGKRTSGQGGPKASPGGRQAQGNANRDERQNDGAQKSGRGKRRGGQVTPTSGGGRNNKRRKGNKMPNKMWSSNFDRFPSDSQPYSMYPPMGAGYSGMDMPRMKQDSNEGNSMFGGGGSYKSASGSNNSGQYQSTPLGGGYQGHGDSSYNEYMSFADDKPMTGGFQGNNEGNWMY